MTIIPMEINVKTDEQKKQDLRTVSTFADKNQRLSWKRKRDKMDKLLKVVRPIEDAMLALILEKQDAADAIEEVRQKMVKECVHPLDYLVHNDTHILCKFCWNKIQVNE